MSLLEINPDTENLIWMHRFETFEKQNGLNLQDM